MQFWTVDQKLHLFIKIEERTIRAQGRAIDFSLSGINGSKQVSGELLDIVVTPIDGETSLMLSNVRIVEQMPISRLRLVWLMFQLLN